MSVCHFLSYGIFFEKGYSIITNLFLSKSILSIVEGREWQKITEISSSEEMINDN